MTTPGAHESPRMNREELALKLFSLWWNKSRGDALVTARVAWSRSGESEREDWCRVSDEAIRQMLWTWSNARQHSPGYGYPEYPIISAPENWQPEGPTQETQMQPSPVLAERPMTPSGSPGDGDLERARAWLSKADADGRFFVRLPVTEDVASLAAEFAACRAEARESAFEEAVRIADEHRTRR